ncbi:hypothetical protein X975_25858, partial [Stegodyphus mimosarum]
MILHRHLCPPWVGGGRISFSDPPPLLTNWNYKFSIYSMLSITKFFSDRQFGFIPNRGTDMALYNTIQFIINNKTNLHVAVVSFDIASAFDSDLWHVLLARLRNINIQRNLYYLIKDYFKNRFIIFDTGFQNIQIKRQVYKGCPQGSSSA